MMLLLLLAAAAAAAGSADATTTTHRLTNEYFRLAVVVGDASLGGHTYVSEVFLNQDHFERSLGFGWTANMVFNYSQHMPVTNRGRLSSTGLVTVDETGASAWHAPLGGTGVITPQQQQLVISGIALGTAATETWTIALNGSSLRWDVDRTMGKTTVNATCDRGPTLVINAEYTTTGHVLHTSAQVPSFLDPSLLWDPLSGVGFQCHISGQPVNRSTGGGGGGGGAVSVGPTAAAPGFWSEALSNRTTQTILLSPSLMQLATTATAEISSTGGEEPAPLMMALSYPTDPGTGGGDTTLSLGLSTIRPPGHAPAVALPQAPDTAVRCGTAPECGAGCQPSDGYLTLGGCKPGSTIDMIEFASFGLASGDCVHGFKVGCTSNNSMAVLSERCLGRFECRVRADSAVFGGDPCPGMKKHLSAAVHCSGEPPPPPPIPPSASNHGATLLTASSQINISWRLNLENGRGLAPFVLDTGIAGFDHNMESFASTFNMWAGNIFGNSPASIVCLHEMSWFAQVVSAFDSPVSGPHSLHDALAAELRMFAKFAVQPNGFVYARWNQYQYINMTIHDQMPHFILCNYWHVVNTGDKTFLAEVWPALNHAMAYVLRGGAHGGGMGMNASTAEAIATTPTAGGVPGEDHADNWLDIVNFGGKDAIINSYLVTALSAMAEMARFLGERSETHASEAQKWRKLHARAVVSFNAQMWNETAGLYSDWIDIRGRRRNYFYVWQQFNAIDPRSGLTNASRAQRMLAEIDQYYSEMRARYNKTIDELWCTPTNLDAARGPGWSGLAPYDGYQQGKLQDQQWFGHYENGCCFMSMMGMELAARGQAGDPNGALALAQRAMQRFNESRFWGQHYDWCEGDHCDGPANGFVGADVLANSALILHGGVRAMFGFHCDLAGVHVVGPPAKLLKEGATHRFVHLGRQTTLTVRNGATVVS
jgi:hypothetical protein